MNSTYRVAAGSGEHLSVHAHGEGEPVVLVHGIPGSSAVWGRVVPRLEREHRVLVPDLLGFGDSSRPSDAAWADRQAEALETLLDGTAGPAALVAHDFGVPVVLSLYRRRPDLVSHLLLAAGNAFPDTPIPLPISAVTWPLVGGLLGRFLFAGPSLAMMLRQGVGKDGPSLDRADYLGDAAQQRAIRQLFASALRNLDELYAPIAEMLPTIAVPTCVVWGGDDPFFSVATGERTAAQIPGGELVVLPGCGHFIPAERPGELAAAITELLARPLSRGRE